MSKTLLTLIVVAALALLSGACGSAAAPAAEEAVAQSATDASSDTSEPSDTTEPSTTDTSSDDSVLPDPTSPPEPTSPPADESDTSDDAVAVEDSQESAGDQGAGTVGAGALAVARNAFAATSAESSYRFDQGLAVHMSMFQGLFEVDIAPEGAIATGEVSGDASHFVIDMGAIFAEAADMGLPGVDADEGELAEIETLLGGATMETWQIGSTMYLDMSEFLGLAGEAAPGADINPGEIDPEVLEAFEQGVVSVDLEQLQLGAAEASSAFLGGSSIVQPEALVDALLAVETIEEHGSQTVRGIDTTVYSGTTTMLAYAETTGVDATSQLGALGDLGFGADALSSLFEEILIDISMMIDDDDLLRRIEIEIDMGEMMTAMFSNPELLGEAFGETPDADDMAELQAFLGDGMELTTANWQEFYDYAADGAAPIVIEAPEGAVDATDEFFELVEGSQLGA